MQLTAPHATLLIQTGRTVHLIAPAHQAITMSDRRNVFNVYRSVRTAQDKQTTVPLASTL
jgi:hypothetical protein